MRRKVSIMSDMTEREAWELDDLLTKTTPEIDPAVEGPFIKHRNMMVILDNLSAEYLTSKMLETKLSPTEIISNMIRKELSLAEIVRP
jgi:hypothetical protein